MYDETVMIVKQEPDCNQNCWWYYNKICSLQDKIISILVPNKKMIQDYIHFDFPLLDELFFDGPFFDAFL